MKTVSDESMARWWAEDLLRDGWTMQDVEDMVDEWLKLMREARRVQDHE